MTSGPIEDFLAVVLIIILFVLIFVVFPAVQDRMLGKVRRSRSIFSPDVLLDALKTQEFFISILVVVLMILLFLGLKALASI